MSAVSVHMAPDRHPWLAQFEKAPVEAFGDLLAGYAAIHPYERADAPDAAKMLFGPLDPDDGARRALGPAILSWLEMRRKEHLPAARPKLQRRIREICEALEIVALLQVAHAAVDLRQRRLVWNDWVARLVLSTARDARAEFWRTLALTQKLVAEKEPAIDVNGLVPMWQQICREAGARLPRHYLSIGLLGLRRLSSADQGSELPWVSGLAQWAVARHPSDAEFKAEWFALKPLYPRAPESWRKIVAKLLSAPAFKDVEIEAPEWWRVDTDFAPMVKGAYRSSEAPLRSPLPQDCDRVIEQLGEPFDKAEPLIDGLLASHRKYLNATGHAQYFVRAIHALGTALIDGSDDVPHARAKKAQAMASEGLKWEPYNRHLWALWRDALVADDALEAAELVGWEFVRRDPEHVNGRNQLAALLGESLGKVDDAETLLKETIEKFPDNAVARTELAELLIFQDRLPEAASVLDAALGTGAANEVTLAARARIYSHEGQVEKAREAVEAGLKLDRNNPVLRQYEQCLNENQTLPLKSQAFRRSEKPHRAEPVALETPEFVEVARLGKLRRLRFELEFAADDSHRQTARQELSQILRDDPTFAYAELLAARHNSWAANPDLLPSFAASFEDALATEDRDKLEKLALQQPRLEALIRVAQALFGDAKAQEQVARWLRDTEVSKDDRAIFGLHAALRPVLRVIEGGLSIKDALAEKRGTIISALYDANEAALGDLLQAA